MKNKIEVIAPAPVLNIPEFHKAFGGRDGVQIPRNSQGHPLHYEFVALPGMRFVVEEILPRHHHCIYRVSTTAYPSAKLYIDSRFVVPGNGTKKTLPRLEEMVKKMERLVGVPYVRGGNWSQGIPQLLHYYPPQGPLDEKTKDLWILKGVDCAGLLYEVTGGFTPRNIQKLLSYGVAVPCQGLKAEELTKILKPMDYVAWPGHLWVVLDTEHAIESESEKGVIKRGLLERLKETLASRSGVNGWDSSLNPEKHFVIRRLEIESKLSS